MTGRDPVNPHRASAMANRPMAARPPLQRRNWPRRAFLSVVCMLPLWVVRERYAPGCLGYDRTPKTVLTGPGRTAHSLPSTTDKPPPRRRSSWGRCLPRHCAHAARCSHLSRIGRRPLVSPPARDHCIAEAVREPVQLKGRCRGSAALLPEAKHQPRPARSGACPPHADDREQAAPHTHRASRAEHGSNSQGLPRRADAMSEAGVRRPGMGRVVRHECNRRGSTDLA